MTATGGPLSGCDVLPPMTPPPSPMPRDRAKGATPVRGRFAVVNAFVDATLAGLTRAELAVWLILWRDTKPTGTARTSQADLARRAGCDVRTVKRAVRSLEAHGLLRVVRRGRLNAGPAVYRVRPVG